MSIVSCSKLHDKSTEDQVDNFLIANLHFTARWAVRNGWNPDAWHKSLIASKKSQPHKPRAASGREHCFASTIRQQSLYSLLSAIRQWEALKPVSLKW